MFADEEKEPMDNDPKALFSSGGPIHLSRPTRVYIQKMMQI